MAQLPGCSPGITCVRCRKRAGEAEGRSLSGRSARRRVLRITLPDGAGANGAGPGDEAGGDGSGSATVRADFLATEEPLGIRVDGAALTLTMRTPGDDVELAAGFLV